MFDNITFTDDPISLNLRTRIEAGAAWLDEVRPDWRGRVDTADLDLSSPTRCVLGQTFADDVFVSWEVAPVSGFNVVYEEVRDAAVNYETAMDWLRSRGFEHDADRGFPYSVLTEAWCEYLEG